jgi:hypothetical protein
MVRALERIAVSIPAAVRSSAEPPFSAFGTFPG